MSDPLRDYHDSLEEWARAQKAERVRTMKDLRTRSRIRELDRRIEASKEKRRQEALDEMWAQWPKTRAAIENCTAVTPESRKTWLDRLESIKNTAKRSAPAQLEELESEVNRLADSLSRISEDLQQAAERRKPNPLTGIQRLSTREPWFPQPNPSLLSSREPSLSRLNPRLFDFPRPKLLAEDLQPIQDAIPLSFSQVSHGLTADWFYQLAHIDLPGIIGLNSSTSAGRAQKLAGDFDAVQASIRTVGSALGYQVTKCRWYWEGC